MAPTDALSTRGRPGARTAERLRARFGKAAHDETVLDTMRDDAGARLPACHERGDYLRGVRAYGGEARGDETPLCAEPSGRVAHRPKAGWAVGGRLHRSRRRHSWRRRAAFRRQRRDLGPRKVAPSHGRQLRRPGPVSGPERRTAALLLERAGQGYGRRWVGDAHGHRHLAYAHHRRLGAHQTADPHLERLLWLDELRAATEGRS